MEVTNTCIKYKNMFDLDLPISSDKDALDRAVREYGHYAERSALKQFCGEREESGDWLRISSLGKPAVCQAIKSPAIKKQLVDAELWEEEDNTGNHKLHHTFHLGDMYEAYVLLQLRLRGYEILYPSADMEQLTVDFAGVAGHPDIVCKYAGVTYLIEVKTMGPVSFMNFAKCPHDDLGYVTQLAVYDNCTSTDDTLWVVLDKGTGITHSIPLPRALANAALTRARKIIPLLRGLTKFSDMHDTLCAPPGEVEIKGKKPTGRLKVPSSMKYFPMRKLFYNIWTEPNGYGKDTEYCGMIDTEGNQVTDYTDLRYIV